MIARDTRMKLFPGLAFLLGASTLAVAASPGEKVQVGFVYVRPASGSAVLREAPDPGAKAVGQPASGARLVFRRVIDAGGGPTWYLVEPPGGRAGWIRAADTSLRRPQAPPPARPIEVVDSGVGIARPSSAQTAAARGLSPMARRYADNRSQVEKDRDFKKAVDHFLTLEAAVDQYFHDPHDEEGNYPDETVAGRKKRAEKFEEGLR